MLPKLDSTIPISKRNSSNKCHKLGNTEFIDNEHTKRSVFLPHIHGSEKIPPSNRKNTIAFQCLLIGQKRNSESNLLEKPANTSYVLEIKEVDNSNREDAIKRLRAEKTMDKIIRSIKPSFCRSRTSSTYEVSTTERNVSNVENREEISVPLSSQNETQEKSEVSMELKQQPDHQESHPLNPTSELQNTPHNPECEHQEPSVSDESFTQKHCEESMVKFDATKEHIELPFSKTKARVPLKKILPLKHLPTDPLMKFRREKRLFAVGIKVKERTDSNKTLNDIELNHMASLIRLCEAYTKNLGPDYLISLAKQSVIPLTSSNPEVDNQQTWQGAAKTIEDANERLWNWEKSLINSNLLRDYQGRPIFNKEMDIRYTSDSPDIYQGSLGPNDYDAKSDVGALLINDSDTSTEIDYNEEDFIESNTVHPFNDTVILAGVSYPSESHDKYLKRVKRKKENSQTSAGSVSQIDSTLGENPGGSSSN